VDGKTDRGALTRAVALHTLGRVPRVLTLMLMVASSVACSNSTNLPRAANPTVTLAPAGRAPVKVRVEVARTMEQRTRGLMFRERLDADAGMIFIFDNDDDQNFWMKNTPLPLDMIFITKDLVVAGVVENTVPFTTDTRSCGQQSRFVLEVNAGFAARNGVVAGTRVEFAGVM
jgi:uncharacterized membrane protein (UPF0127 family)